MWNPGMRSWAMAVACAVGAGAAGCAPAVKDYPYFLNQLVDLDRLAVMESGVQCKQFSSYDRKSRYDEATGAYVDWAANGDAGQYLRTDPKTGEGVMAEIDGPGCIWRIWSANPQGKIRFYFDGAETPNCEFDFNQLFSGKVAGFPRPLVWQRRVVLGGDNPASNCYVPIPFARSCKVTADKPHGQYYHIGYTTYPRDRVVKTFSLQRSPVDEAALQRACELLSKCGEDPQPTEALRLVERKTTLQPGDKSVHEITGPGTIRQFFAKLDSAERWARRKVLLQMYWDGEATPSVEAPIGDFFGDAWDEAPYRSLPLGITNDLNYCYWRMPYARSARIVFTNQGGKPADLRYRVGYRSGPLAADTARFHAKWRRDRNSRDFDYLFLECRGRGRFVGAVLFPDNIVGGWWGEGDEKVWVDGEKFPSTFGTGSEDYFGDAWGIRHFVNPYHGCPTPAPFEQTRRQSCYRWHIGDSIPFTRSFRITIENYSAFEKGAIRNDYSSMAYWYQMPGGSDTFAPVPVAERIPQGPIAAGALDADACDRLPPGVSIVSDEELPEQVCNGKALRLAGKAGTVAILMLPAPDDGQYHIEVVTVKGVPASTFELRRDGKPLGDRVRLRNGPNPIEVRLTGKPVRGEECEVLLDYFRLHVHRNFARDWYLIGPFDNAGNKGVDTAYGPEKEAFDARKTFAGRGGDVGWKKIHVASGIVESPQGYFQVNENIVLYAYTEVEAAEAFKAAAFVGSDDGVQVWINGRRVHRNSKQRALKVDEDRFDVDLKAGRNTILLKIDQQAGPWGFAFRLNDPDEKLTWRLPE